MAGRGGMRQRVGPEPVARFERGALVEHEDGQRLAAFVGGGEQHVVDLDGAGPPLDLLIALLQGLAGLAVGAARPRTGAADR